MQRWCLAAWLAVVAPCAPVFAQDRPVSFGAEVAFRSGHADRGFVINDRPVAQPVVWVAGRGAEFSVWGSFPLVETTDRARPQIVEMELTRKHDWSHFTIAPAVRMFFYHDPLSTYRTSSVEAWLYLSYHAGPFRVFSNHSLDVRTYRGAYFGEAGIASEGRVSPQVEVGGSVAAGWASATFNEAYADVATAGLDRVSAEGWLTAYLNPRCYIGQHVEVSTIVNDRVRTALARPTFFFIRLTTGVEF